MLSKLSLSEKAIIYSQPTVKTITNTIADAVDDAATKAHAYTSTVKSTFDEVVYSGSATDITLDASSRLTLGVFLANDQDSSQLIHVVGSCRLVNIGTSLTCPGSFGFGRCNATTVTQSDAAAANIIDNGILLPSSSYVSSLNNNSATLFQHSYFSIDHYILIDKKTTTSDNPVCFYLQFLNVNAGAAVTIQFAAALSIRSMNYAVPINTPAGV